MDIFQKNKPRLKATASKRGLFIERFVLHPVA